LCADEDCEAPRTRERKKGIISTVEGEKNNMEGEADLRCAYCGIVEVDGIKLEKCPTCKLELVRYCSVQCQREHRSQHKQACQKRVAELCDEILFQQPEGSHLGDCPICLLPLPLDDRKSRIMSCCYKNICNGCAYANDVRELKESLEHTCPFCRLTLPASQAEVNRNVKKRVLANDPAAIRGKGLRCHDKGDYRGAFECFTKAAESGDDADAHDQLGRLYHKGEGVEKDMNKAAYHWEQAAIRGHPVARYNLAILGLGIGRCDDDSFKRATKHWVIAACIGHDPSLERLKDGFKRGFVKKEDFAAALRGHQAAVDATKSPQRQAAEAAKLDD